MKILIATLGILAVVSTLLLVHPLIEKKIGIDFKNLDDPPSILGDDQVQFIVKIVFARISGSGITVLRLVYFFYYTWLTFLFSLLIAVGWLLIKHGWG